jgi:hypothetical protein
MNNSANFTIPTAADIEEAMFDNYLALEAAKTTAKIEAQEAKMKANNIGVPFECPTIASLTAIGCEFTNA